MAKRGGITLIEITLALAIASVLTISALRATISLARGQDVEEGLEAVETLSIAVKQILQVDLQVADECKSIDGGFALRTRSTLEAGTLVRRLRPAIVRYEVITIGPRSWLLRTQVADNKKLTELLCAGATRVQLVQAGRDWHEMPEAIEAVVELADRPDEPITLRCRIR